MDSNLASMRADCLVEKKDHWMGWNSVETKALSSQMDSNLAWKKAHDFLRAPNWAWKKAHDSLRASNWAWKKARPILKGSN